MKKEENNLRAEICGRIATQLGGDKGISTAFNKLRDEEGWTTPQPLYNVKNGKANLTATTLHDLGSIDANFSADIAIFGEYRFPMYVKELQEKMIAFEQHLQKESEEKRRAEVRAERAESLNEVLQSALKEAMITNGVNFPKGDINRLLVDDYLMMVALNPDFNKGWNITHPNEIN